MLKPTVDEVEIGPSGPISAIKQVNSQISLLQADLRSLSSNQGCPLNLESYISKLANSKKRVTVVANILATAQDRLNRVHQACLRETAKRRALLEPSPATTPSGPEAPARLPQ